MKRKTIGDNPLDELGGLKGRGRNKLPEVDEDSARAVRAALLPKRRTRGLLDWLLSWFR